MTKPETEWVLVPRSPTREMLNAAIDVDSFKLGDIGPLGFRCSPQQLFEKCFAAMLSAAPLAPSTPDAGVVKEWEERRPWPEYGTVADWLAATTAVGDRLAASHTEQANAIGALFSAIAHGDEAHRAWLKQAIEDHFAGRPIQRDASHKSRHEAIIEAEDAIWNAVIERCMTAWPGKIAAWAQSPLELIRDLINERDDSAATITEQAKRIAELEDTAHKSAILLRTEIAASREAESQLASLKAEVERLTREAENAEAWADNLKLQLASAKGWEKRNREAATTAEAERDTARVALWKAEETAALAQRIAESILNRTPTLEWPTTGEKEALEELAALPLPALPPAPQDQGGR